MTSDCGVTACRMLYDINIAIKIPDQLWRNETTEKRFRYVWSDRLSDCLDIASYGWEWGKRPYILGRNSAECTHWRKCTSLRAEEHLVRQVWTRWMASSTTSMRKSLHPAEFSVNLLHLIHMIDRVRIECVERRFGLCSGVTTNFRFSKKRFKNSPSLFCCLSTIKREKKKKNKEMEDTMQLQKKPVQFNLYVQTFIWLTREGLYFRKVYKFYTLWKVILWIFPSPHNVECTRASLCRAWYNSYATGFCDTQCWHTTTSRQVDFVDARRERESATRASLSSSSRRDQREFKARIFVYVCLTLNAAIWFQVSVYIVCNILTH